MALYLVDSRRTYDFRILPVVLLIANAVLACTAVAQLY